MQETYLFFIARTLIHYHNVYVTLFSTRSRFPRHDKGCAGHGIFRVQYFSDEMRDLATAIFHAVFGGLPIPKLAANTDSGANDTQISSAKSQTVDASERKGQFEFHLLKTNKVLRLSDSMRTTMPRLIQQSADVKVVEGWGASGFTGSCEHKSKVLSPFVADTLLTEKGAVQVSSKSESCEAAAEHAEKAVAEVLRKQDGEDDYKCSLRLRGDDQVVQMSARGVDNDERETVSEAPLLIQPVIGATLVADAKKEHAAVKIKLSRHEERHNQEISIQRGQVTALELRATETEDHKLMGDSKVKNREMAAESAGGKRKENENLRVESRVHIGESAMTASKA